MRADAENIQMYARIEHKKGSGAIPFGTIVAMLPRKDNEAPDAGGCEGSRHRIEQVFQEGKGKVGLGQYEARGWLGWHHHITLSLLALWFLQLERRRAGKKTPALTMPQLRKIRTRLLERKPTAAAIAEEIREVARRNEEARIYHWHKATATLPPRRRRTDT